MDTGSLGEIGLKGLEVADGARPWMTWVPLVSEVWPGVRSTGVW
jgi:hypothetical protein